MEFGGESICIGVVVVRRRQVKQSNADKLSQTRSCVELRGDDDWIDLRYVGVQWTKAVAAPGKFILSQQHT